MTTTSFAWPLKAMFLQWGVTEMTRQRTIAACDQSVAEELSAWGDLTHRSAVAQAQRHLRDMDQAKRAALQFEWNNKERMGL